MAGSYFGALLFAASPPTMGTASIRALVVFAVGAGACLLGVLTRHRRGEQDATEDRLAETESVFRRPSREPPAAWPSSTSDGDLLQVNQALCDLLGHPREALLETAWSGYLHPDDAVQHAAAVERLVAGEAWSIQKEVRLRLKDRRSAWGIVGMSLVHDFAARPRHLFLHVTNLTDRVRAEARLRQSEAHFRNLFETSPDPVVGDGPVRRWWRTSSAGTPTEPPTWWPS